MLSPEDKQLISEYMGWNYADISLFNHVHPLDLNDAGLCVEKMSENHEFDEFCDFITENIYESQLEYKKIAWMFWRNEDHVFNFFSAMASWLRSK